jgi:hypothetical protein
MLDRDTGLDEFITCKFSLKPEIPNLVAQFIRAYSCHADPERSGALISRPLTYTMTRNAWLLLRASHKSVAWTIASK